MFCGKCGGEINNKAVVCVHCGVRRRVSEPDAITMLLLPVGRSDMLLRQDT